MHQEETSARFVGECALAALGLSPESGVKAWSGEVAVGGKTRVYQLFARRGERHLEANVMSFDAAQPQERKEEAELLWERAESGQEAATFRVDGRPATQEEALARIAACAAFAHKVRDRK